MPPCTFEIPAKGHQKSKVCGKPEFKDGLCQAHQPKPLVVAPTAVALSWIPKPKSDESVDATFQSLCDDMSGRIETVMGGGIHPGGMAFTGGKGSHQLLHDTQPHSNNVFFYNWQGNVLVVYGVGSHTGTTNKQYDLTWFDGRSAHVDLGKKTIS